MIEVREVRATPNEMRPVRAGWGALRWIACLPMVIPYFGMLVMALSVGPFLPFENFLAIIGVTYVLWIGSNFWIQRTVIGRVRNAPTNAVTYDWTLDGEGLKQVSPLLRGQIAWEGFIDVKEEKDRFVFLLTPYNNPVLPKRQMTAEQIDALRALITQVRSAGRLGRGVD